MNGKKSTKPKHNSAYSNFSEIAGITNRFVTISSVLLLMIILSSSSAFAIAKTWTGSASTAWGNASNWSPSGVPVAADAVTINSGGNQPLISSETVSITSLAVSTGATLSVTGGSLTVSGGTLTVSGTIDQSGGTFLTTIALSLSSGASLKMSGTGLLHLGASTGTTPTVSLTLAANTTVVQSGGTIETLDISVATGTPAGNYSQTAGTLAIYRDYKTGGIFNATGGNVNFLGNASAPTFSTGTIQFYNVTVASGVSPKFDVAVSSAFSVAGDFTYNSLTGISTNSTITFNGTVDQSIYTVVPVASATAFGNLTLNKASGKATLLANAKIAGNVTITNGTLNLDVNTANRTSAGGTLSVSATGKLMLGANTGGQTGSNFPLNYSTVTLTTGSTIEYSGSNAIAQTIYAGVTYSNLTLTNGTGSGSSTKNTTANITVNNNLTINTGALLAPAAANTVGGTGTLTGYGTAQVTRTTAVADFLTQYSITTKAITNLTIDYNATLSQTINAVNYGNLTISGARGANNVVLAGSGSIGISGTFTTSATFSTGTYTVSGSTVTFNGITTQYCPVFTFNHITIDKTAGDVVLNGSITVGGTLTFATTNVGKVSTGINAVICTAGTVTGASQTKGWINGSLQRNFTNVNLSRTFDVGGSTYYTPVTLTFAAVSSSGNINITGNDGSHPNIVSNGFTISKNVPFYWKVANAGSVVFTSYTLSLTWDNNLNYSPFTLSALKIGRYSGTAWSVPAAYGTPSSTASTTNVQAGSITAMGDFIAGEMCDVNAGFSYPSTPYCTNSGSASITLNSGSTAGSFTYTGSGLSLNAGSGVVTLNTSTAGTYSVTNTATGTGGCTAASTATIVVTQAPNATISYTGGSYCTGGGTASVSRTGTTGGTFSNSSSLVLDATTGDITLASSPVGAHTVSYTIASANGCSAYTATTSVTVYSTPAASISYTGTPFCTSTSTGAVTRTGATGGTYSSSAGLTINASTGEINPTTSTAGSYTVYSTVSSGCTALISTSVTIQQTPSASIVYNGIPWCNKSGSATVTLTGDAGGTYSSTTGLVITVSTGAVNKLTSTPGSYTVTYTIAASGGCPQFQTTAPFVLTDLRTWTGLTNSNWNDATNWDCQDLPSKITDVYIPSNIYNFPNLSNSVEVKNLTLESSALLTILNVTLKIKGTATTYGGKINALAGKVEFSGTSPQTIPANLFLGNTTKSLQISNPTTVTLAGPLKVMSTVSFGVSNSAGLVNNCTFNTGGLLTLASDSSYNAGIIDITNGGFSSGNTISGDVTVERFVRSKRCYRFLSAPVNSSGNIQANWQENSMNPGYWTWINPYPGYGTHITGAGANLNGFDLTHTNNPSMWTWDNTTQQWVPLPNTYGYFKAGTGYRIIVRGDRSVDMNTNTPPSTITTLRAKGSVVTGDVIMAKAGGGGTANMPELTSVIGNYSYVANPYANGILWSAVTKSDIASSVYIFDPTITGANGKGGYIAYNPVTNTTNIPSNLDNNLQSGQSFFVETTGPNPTLTFKETHKTSVFRYVFRQNSSPEPRLSAQLFIADDTASVMDGVVAVYSDHYENTVGDEDSYKFTNPDENMGIIRDGRLLAIEGRKPIVSADTLQLKIWKYTTSKYLLKIAMTDFEPGIDAYFEDLFENTSTKLTPGDTTLIGFDISSDTASKSATRFRIVFRTSSTLPLVTSSITAYSKDKAVQVEWNTNNEVNVSKYELERSSNAQAFEKLATISPKYNTGAAADYSYSDNNPFKGTNYYRVKTMGKAGEVRYSKIVKVTFNSDHLSNSIVISPNPISGSAVSFITNNIDEGNYVAKLFNRLGQIVITANISQQGTTGKHAIALKQNLPSGLYSLQLSNGDKEYVTDVVVK